MIASSTRLAYEQRMSKNDTVSGWGRIPQPGREVSPDDLRRAPNVPLFRGLGRSYGDSAIPPASNPVVVSTVRADRILAFDPVSGVLRAEAGLSLLEMNRVFLPRGFFTPVTPGTQYVTLGGMVAADVHGKNHHVEGCFGMHVRRVLLRVADGRLVQCGPEEEPELFWATVGGMGLTGHILEVEVQLKRIPSPWILKESVRVPNVDAYVDELKDAATQWPYTVGWLDCLSQGSDLGRGLLDKGRWAEPHEAPQDFPKEPPRLHWPVEAPSVLLNPLTIKAFNFAWYWKHFQKKKTGVVGPWGFFYPLDFIQGWNLMYGPRGFTQYQCVLPEKAGRGAARKFLELLTSRGGASFLCVIKDCGPEGKGLLSFPMAGISVALDIPVRDNTQALVDELNEFVIAEGGRIYLAKDTFTRREHFEKMEPRLERFLEVRRKWDPKMQLKSAQSIRLFGDPA